MLNKTNIKHSYLEVVGVKHVYLEGAALADQHLVEDAGVLPGVQQHGALCRQHHVLAAGVRPAPLPDQQPV